MMNNEVVLFNPIEHKYTIDGKDAISVTRLLQKHGLTTDFSKVPQDILQRKIAHGTQVHKEIEEFVTSGKLGNTQELGLFIHWMMSKGIVPHNYHAEQTVWDAYKGVAGTYDALAFYDGQYTLIDYKTSHTLNMTTLSWQLSLYEYLLKEHCEVQNLVCLHFKDGEIREIQVPRIPEIEIDRLLLSEMLGEIYCPLVVDLSSILAPELIKRVTYLETHLDNAKRAVDSIAEDVKAIEQHVLDAMVQANVKTWELPNGLKYTLVGESEVTKFDAKTAVKENPWLEKYNSTSTKKAYLRRTWSKQDDNQKS